MPASPTSRTSARSQPLLSRADFERHLLAHAALIAPSDVTALLGRRAAIRRRLIDERAVHPTLARRARVALDLLDDHARGACPQIPLQTISLLTTALYYYLTPMDVIPDFVPRAGTADDALMLEIAWRLAAPGVQRYVDWKGLEPGDAAPGTATRARTRRPDRGEKPRAAKTRPRPARRR